MKLKKGQMSDYLTALLLIALIVLVILIVWQIIAGLFGVAPPKGAHPYIY